MNPVLLPTSIVGSDPQPEWLIDRKKLADRLPPRTRARELWRVSPEFLEVNWAFLKAWRGDGRIRLAI